MKWSIRHTCGLIFIVLCAAVFIYLHQFTVSKEPMQYILWESSTHILADGTEEPYDTGAYALPPAKPDGSSYRFSATLPEGLTDGYLMFETSGLEISLLLDGAEYTAEFFTG